MQVDEVEVISYLQSYNKQGILHLRMHQWKVDMLLIKTWRYVNEWMNESMNEWMNCIVVMMIEMIMMVSMSMMSDKTSIIWRFIF